MRIARLAAAALLMVASAGYASDLRSSVQAYRQSHEMQILGQLDDLTRIDSVAANPSGLQAAANRLQVELKARGFETRQLSASAGPPAVFAQLITPGARRTVVFYAHYDGQPVTPSQWATPPFAPAMRSGTLAAGAPVVDWKSVQGPLDPEWRLYARAASDDKSSIVSFLAGFDALKASGHKPGINIKVLWEGEEEANSPHLGEILSANKALLASDLWLIGDGPVHQTRRQQIYFGARGNTSLEMTFYGPLRPLHSGHYGNWAPNPAVMAAEVITRMRDDEGRILIPGFSDDVRPLTAAETASIAALPPVEGDLKREFAIGRSEGEEGLTASTMRPAINIRGFRSGGVGTEVTNSIPAEAVVSVDFRLVPGQTPDSVRRKVDRFLSAQGWTLTEQTPDLATRLAHPRIIRMNWEGGYRALRTDMTTAVSKAVIATASKAAGEPVAVLPMMGGSVPIYLFDDIFAAPVIGLPVANHDNNQHAPNENLRLKNLWDGVVLYAEMIGELRW